MAASPTKASNTNNATMPNKVSQTNILLPIHHTAAKTGKINNNHIAENLDVGVWVACTVFIAEAFTKRESGIPNAGNEMKRASSKLITNGANPIVGNSSGNNCCSG